MAAIARKEFADYIISLRFFVLFMVLAVAVIVPVFLASGVIRDLAQRASGASAVFLALFTISGDPIPTFRFYDFMALLAPLLGIAFGFDAINAERSEGTLPRLLAQPIHRDDVINGKYVAGVAVIGIIVAALTLFVSGLGIFRLGVTPAGSEVIRLVSWFVVTVVYISLWLGFAILCSVLIRRSATAALVAFGSWLAIAIFGNLIVDLISNVIAPQGTATFDEQLRHAQVQELIGRLLPPNLYQEATVVLLNPTVTRVSVPLSLAQAQQAAEQIPSLVTLEQSFLLVWPQVVALVAITIVLFALAYVAFMRQEVRA